MRVPSALLTIVGLWVTMPAAAAEKAYTLVPDEHGMILKTPDGRTVFRYMTKKPAQSNLTANSVCCLYPVNTPSGERAVDFAPGDHRHHRGVFLAWHAMDCGSTPADFWGWGSWAPTEDRVIRSREVKLVEADADHAEVRVLNDWTIDDDTVVQEQTSISTREQQGVFVIDLRYLLEPKVDVTIRQTAFGGFCVKCRKEGKASYFSPQGHVDLPPPHHLKPETDWPAADWYDYTISLDGGNTVGVAVVDHPSNPPSKWHNLEPIAMINPCIVADGPVTLKEGRPLELRYRLIVHDGPPPRELLAKLAAEW